MELNSSVMINITIVLCLFFIAAYLMYCICFKIKRECVKKNLKTLIVIGSGGHTLEMIRLLKSLDPKLYGPRLYVMAGKDTSSEYKIKELESNFKNYYNLTYEIRKIPRSRALQQSYFTSVFTTFWSTLISIPIVFRFKPDLILSNGPGTCIPVCITAFLMNKFLLYNIKIVFVESICRVKTLSLSGRILLYFANVVIVQWDNLHKKYPQTVFLGRLI